MRGPVEVRPGGDYSGSPASSKRGVENSLFGVKERNRSPEIAGSAKVSPPRVEVSSGKGKEVTVESWEEIADGGENQPSSVAVETSKEDAEQLQLQAVIKTAKVVEAVASRKQPSPTLSKRLARSKEGESSSSAKGVAKPHLAPPPKKEDEK